MGMPPTPVPPANRQPINDVVPVQVLGIRMQIVMMMMTMISLDLIVIVFVTPCLVNNVVFPHS